MTNLRVIERSTLLPFSADRVYAWHTRPGAFERLVPPWDRVEVVERSGPLAEGTEVRLRVHLGPLPVTWVARHRDVHEGLGFTDVQVSGPFASWVHSHRFTPRSEGGSVLSDRIEYRLPCGRVGELLGGRHAHTRIDRMLEYRHRTTADDLTRHAAAPGPLTVAITGQSGLVGRALSAFLTSGGHRVIPLVRRRAGPGELHWDPGSGSIDAAGLEGVDAVIHLAGENIAGGRWTAARKRRIASSRLDGTRLLATTLARLSQKPAVLISASAVGIYGDRGDEILTEASPTGSGFLAELGQAWEEASAAASDAGIRVVLPRLGIVLTPGGGALQRMLPPFRLGVGGPLGSGRQWMSWLTLDDAVGMLHYLLTTPDIAGPVNAVAPEPTTNSDFAGALGRVLRRPAILPVPAPILEALFGELAREALLAGQRVRPALLEARGYPFRDPALLPALRRILGVG